MTTQQAVLSAWGKSTAVRLPSQLVKQANLRIGQTVQFDAAPDGSITIRPVLERPNLEELLARITPENLPDEADVSWGRPVGSEVW